MDAPAQPRTKRPRAGITLVEVMLAGALLAFACCAFMEALLVTRRILHDENGGALAADAYAFDVAWTLLNAPDRCFENITFPKSYLIPSNDVPALYAGTWRDPCVYIDVYATTNATDLATNALNRAGKWVSVNVTWGPAGTRRQLWGGTPCESDVVSFYDRNPRRVFRPADVRRMQERAN